MNGEEPSAIVDIPPVRYRVLFRGRKEASRTEMIDYVYANDLKEAVDQALSIAAKNQWHLERVERVL